MTQSNQPPQDPRKKPSRQPDDDFELRPLERLNPAPDDPTAAPATSLPAAPELAPAPQPIPHGMLACASCLAIKSEAEVALQPDGRFLCKECAATHRRLHAREESRMAAAAHEAVWFDLPDSSAWVMVLVVPAFGWIIFAALMAVMRRAHTLPVGYAALDAVVLLGIVAAEAVLFFAALGIGSMVFSGLDLPSLPNRLWKILLLLVVDVGVFVWFVSMWQSLPCMLPVYLMVVRPFFMGVGLIILLGLELIESALVTVIAWCAIWLLLLSAVARGFFFWGLPQMG